MTQNEPISARSDLWVLQVLRERITRSLISGGLEHGDRLSSVREVARELDVGLRAVLTAYQQLVEEGLVEIRSRSGVFAIRALAPLAEPPAVPRRWMVEMLLGAIERNIPPIWLADRMLTALTARRMRVAVLECNDDQLHSMREELSTYFGVDAIAVPLEGITQTNVPEELRAIDLLVSAGHANEVSRIAAEIDKPFVITNVRPSLVNRLVRLLGQGSVYFLVTDPRFGVKMRRLIAPMARSENFHVLVVDQDDLRVIPSNAPTYVMRTARTRLTGKSHLGREIPTQRIFSEETSRELLSRVLEMSSNPDAFPLTKSAPSQRD